MKKRFLLLAALGAVFLSKSQITSNSQWTFIKGDNAVNKTGTYGTKGVASITNKPGGRRGSITWKDKEGNLWLYGGYGYATTATTGTLNDLWKFSPQAMEWTWIHGADTVNPRTVFGSLGVAADANTPGGLSNGSPSWKDNEGNFWVMGPSATLWKYTIQSNQWTWMKGDTATVPASANWGMYGTKGVADINNDPGTVGQLFWTDKNGKFWMYKTSGYTSAGFGFMNDVWKYDPATNMWTWMNGDSALHSNGRSVYGTKGVAHANNYPGSRRGVVTWTDQNGNLWAFGGRGTVWIPQGIFYSDFYLNDLWRFSTSTGQWTWVSGDSTSGTMQFGNYGTQGQAATTNMPGIRQEASGVPDNQGNLWLFHGIGASSNSTSDILNDYWKYDPAANQWTWMKGDMTGSKAGTYGTQGMANAANKPGSRSSLSSWADVNIWVFGGEGYGSSGDLGLLNDLWKLSTVHTFTGFGTWFDPSNWLNGQMPPNNVSGGMTIIIDPQKPPGHPMAICSAPTLKVQPGGTVTINSGFLELQHNLENDGVINGSGEVLFVGSANSPIDSTVQVGNTVVVLSSSGILNVPVTFYKNTVYLKKDTRTSGIKLLSGSKIRLDSFNLYMDTASISGVDENNFIITNNTGKLFRSVGTADILFPIGTDNLSYTPVTISKLFNTGSTASTTTSDFGVSVRSGVQVENNALTKGAVNRTWFVSRSDTSSFRVNASWNATDEMPGFTRASAMISLACPPPDDCISGFDRANPQTVTGSGPFSIARTGPFLSPATSFIVRNSLVQFEFTGSVDNDWSNAANWSGGLIPSSLVIDGMEVTINNDCSFNGSIRVKPGGKLIVKAGKQVNVTGNIIIE